MLTSLFTAVSGMNSNGTALSVISDNVANMNTTAFKMSTVAFGDVLSQTMGSTQIGRGVMINDVQSRFTQGSFESSPSVLDIAIDGDGFFIVKDGNDTFYTRAGQFGIDKTGYAISPEGKRLQGYLFSDVGIATSTIGDINIASINSQPSDTDNVTINVNLDSRETIPAAFDVNDPDTTSNFSSSITVYDSLGNGHIITIYFRKSVEAAAGNTWEWFAVVDNTDSASGSTEVQARGILDFDNNGALDDESAITYPLASNGFDFTGGAAAGQVIDFDFGTSITEGGLGMDGTTQFGTTSTTAFQDQDGYAAGSLKNLTVSEDGVMTGIFTNGQTKSIAKIALGKFVNPSGLTKMGRNLYAESYDSGQPIITAPGDTGAGQVLSNTLELSNVDLALEFVKMIISQRGFQANSRIVSTTDELMVELVNLKR